MEEDFVFKEILPRLPSKSIMRFTSVSKTWLAHISNDKAFIADHIDHHSPFSAADIWGITRADYSNEGSLTAQPRRLFFVGRQGTKLAEIDMSYIKTKFHRLTLVGSCNGLVCIGLRYKPDVHGDLVVWNPLTRDFKSFPEPVQPMLSGGLIEYYFGFDKENNDYKVVRTEGTQTIHNLVDVQIFSVRSCRWRQLDRFSGFRFLASFGEGLNVGGNLHWPIGYDNRGTKGRMFDVLSFDFSSEEFQEFKGPVCTRDDTNFIGLVEWKGCLGALSVSMDWKEWKLWLRISKSESSDFYWTMNEIVIDISYHPTIKYTKVIRDQLVLVSNRNHRSYLYDLNTRETKELENGLSSVWLRCDLYDHTHSLC